MSETPRLEDFPLRSFDKLRYGDTDRQGHVNNAVFTTLLETGRVEFIYGGGEPMQDAGCSFVIARLELDYVAEILWPGQVQTGSRIRSVGRSSIHLEQAIFQGERLVARALSILVQVGDTSRKSQPFSPALLDRLRSAAAGSSGPASVAAPSPPSAARAPEAKAPASIAIRKATLDDRGALEALIAHSARTLTLGSYTPRQVETGLRAAFGVDTQLIRDGTYFIAEERGVMVGCGGWSFRRTMFGSDARAHRDSAELDPKRDAAKVRAFFIHPDHARRGVGGALLQRCEAEARAAGFRRMELLAMRSGVAFYQSHGYEAGAPVLVELEPGLSIEFQPMARAI